MAPPPSRRQMLENFIAQRPEDPFPRYALALEHKNAGELEAAWGHFEALIAAVPDYTAGYLHAGNTLLALGRTLEARKIYTDGIAACQRKGDSHAQGELEGALGALP